MARTRRRQGKAALFCASLQLALSFALTADLVLCRSASGHVAIESALSGDCCTSHGLPASVRESEHCRCIDTPLLDTPLDSRSKVVRALPGPPAALPGARSVAPPPLAGDGFTRTESRPPIESLAAIRSVVLLV